MPVKPFHRIVLKMISKNCMPRNLNAFIEIKVCEICQKEFYGRTQRKGGSCQRGVRGVNIKTCSKICSRIRTLRSHRENSRKWKLKQKQLVIQGLK